MKGNCFYITCKAFAGQVELIFLVLGKFHIPPKNECKVIFSCKNPAQLEKKPSESMKLLNTNFLNSRIKEVQRN